MDQDSRLPEWCVKGASFLDVDGDPWIVVHVGEGVASLTGMQGRVLGAKIQALASDPILLHAHEILDANADTVAAADVLLKKLREPEPSLPRPSTVDFERARARFIRDVAARIFARAVQDLEGDASAPTRWSVLQAEKLYDVLAERGWGFELEAGGWEP